jgi:hypothetical protein
MPHADTILRPAAAEQWSWNAVSAEQIAFPNHLRSLRPYSIMWSESFLWQAVVERMFYKLDAGKRESE